MSDVTIHILKICERYMKRYCFS